MNVPCSCTCGSCRRWVVQRGQTCGYCQDGHRSSVEVRAKRERKRRDPARFQPFSSFQFSKADCDAVGVPRDRDGAAQFTHERQLNEMQAHMKRTGRYCEWKAH